MQHPEICAFQFLSHRGARIPQLWLSFKQFSFHPLTQIFTPVHFDLSELRPQSHLRFMHNDMLHSLSGFPFR